MVKVLYNGWPLVYALNSPGALHLLAILDCQPEGIEMHLALPGEPPAWIPGGASLHRFPTPDTPRSRLAWEQRTLPGLRSRLEADLLHLTSPNPPLFGPAMTAVSPAGFHELRPQGDSNRSLSERLRQAASQGGMARLSGLFWPEDLPEPQGMGPIFYLPPVAYPVLAGTEDALSAVDLPDSYVLYHSPPGETALRRLLAAWSWAAGPLGEATPLVALGLGQSGRERLSSLAAEYGLGQTVHSLPDLSPAEISAVYRRSAALISPVGEPPWGGPLRLALAQGIPVVSILDPCTEAIAGPAAYLVKKEDTRALGAALITVLVEMDIADRLVEAGRGRSAGWSLTAFSRGLRSAYIQVLHRRT